MRNRRIYLLFGLLPGIAIISFVYGFFVLKMSFIDLITSGIDPLLQGSVPFLTIFIISIVMTRQTLNSMTDAELFKLSQELPQATRFKSSCVLVTESFVIGRNVGLVILPIDEILLVHEREFFGISSAPSRILLRLIPYYASTFLLSASNQTFSIAGRFFPLSQARKERGEIMDANRSR
jgi:hypothetical protein